MQIQSDQVILPTVSPTSNRFTDTTQVKTSTSTLPTSESSVHVSLSRQAQQLAQEPVEIQPVPQPTAPQTPLSGEKLAQAVQIKKAQLHYQVASDMVNLATGNNSDGLSLASTYYLSQNEEARSSVLSIKADQQNKQNMQAYQEQTASLNEQYA